MDILKPEGSLDVIFYYSRVAAKLTGFLKGKEIATKIWLPKGIPFFIKRGSKEKPLYVEEMLKYVDGDFLELRKKGLPLSKARPMLGEGQEKVWEYFVPKKLMDFFYATNGEGPGKPIERIFLDMDRKGVPPESARKVAQELVRAISRDGDFRGAVGEFTFFTMWTGTSFHVYLMLKKAIPNSIYDSDIRFSKNKPLESFTGRWIEGIKVPGVKVAGGHEKREGFVNTDPSQTPSGKLARAPFSLHMRSARDVDGVAVPLTQDILKEKNLVRKLEAYTPEKVLKELDTLGKRIPPG